MKQNITLSLDKDLIKKGKIIASKKETSLNRLLSDFLKQIIEEEDFYEHPRPNDSKPVCHSTGTEGDVRRLHY